MDPMVEGGMGWSVGAGTQLAEMLFVASGSSHESKLNRMKALIGMEVAMTATSVALIYFGWKENNPSMIHFGGGLLISRANWWFGLSSVKIL